MTPQKGTLAEEVIFVVGGANDAPGFKIVSDGHGGITIVPIPGWNPEQAVELGAALKVIASAASIKQPEASKAILGAATKLAHAEIGRMVGKSAGGQHSIIIIGG